MSGRVIRVLELTQFNWGGSSIAANTIVTAGVAIHGIDVSASRETVVLVRVHAFSSAGTGGSMSLTAMAEAPTNEDPSVIFVDSTTPLLNAQSLPTSAGSLYRGVITSPPGGWMMLQITATQGNAAGSLKGTLSIDISLKD